MVHLTVFSYHVTYARQSESTLYRYLYCVFLYYVTYTFYSESTRYRYLNVKKLLAQKRHDI